MIYLKKNKKVGNMKLKIKKLKYPERYQLYYNNIIVVDEANKVDTWFNKKEVIDFRNKFINSYK